MNHKFLYIIFVVFLISCSKDKDDISPVITINSPISMQQVNEGDIIQISGTITDDQNIESVTISLRDNQNTPVLTRITKTPDKTGVRSYTINIPYSFDNLQMEGGQYDFKITAYDGENMSEKYIPIRYEESEKFREGIFVIGNSGNFASVYLVENNFNSSFYRNISGDFMGAALDPYNQQLINVSKMIGSISATGLEFGNELWSVPVLGNPPTPFYTGFYYYDQHIYLGKRNGGVQGYDRNGNPDFTAGTSVNYFMESAFIHDDEYFIMEEQGIVSGSSGSISLAWLYSGDVIQHTAINSDIKGMYSSIGNTVVLLANDASLNAEILFYDVLTGGINSPFNISSLGKIDDCLEISNGVYLIAATGNLTLVDINSFSTFGYLLGVPAEKIWIDKLADELYVANGSLLTIYDFSDRTIKGTYTHTESIKEVVFWYNK